MKNIIKLCVCPSILCLAFIFSATGIFAQDRVNIKVLTKEIGHVNKLVYGSSILGWRQDNDKTLKGNASVGGDFGYGLWDPTRCQPAQEAKSLAINAGIKIFRLTGMWHNWTEAIDMPGYKRKYKFGVDEQMRVCSEVGADAIVCIQYLFDDAKEAQEIVEYLNGTADPKLIGEIKALGSTLSKIDKERLINTYVKNAGGVINWPDLRAINGHLDPYQIKYFEIGNETWYLFTPEKYARIYLRYYEQLKKVDPAIKIGAVLYKEAWDEKIMEIVKDKIDFGVVHTYPTPAWGDKLGRIAAKEIFNASFLCAEFEHEGYIRNLLARMEKYSGKDVPVAVTEFNGGFAQNKPVPYRHCLGTALLNAELIRIFMKPENDILMANCWNFINEYWGMIANGFTGGYADLNKPYYKRPNFYTLELYNKHFGDVLLNVDVNHGKHTCDVSEVEPVRTLRTKVKDDLSDIQVRKFNFNALVVKNNGRYRINVPYLSVNASKSKDGEKVYLMVINRNPDTRIPSMVDLSNFFPAHEANAWVLNGPSINATNENNPNTVTVRQVTTTMKNNIFEFTFEPHSLTAIEVERK